MSVYVSEYGNLRVNSLNQEAHERTCGYWYTVTSGATAATAFRTRAELDKWLAEYGLTLGPAWKWENDRQVDCELADPGTFSTAAIIGSYRRASHRDRAVFDAIEPLLETLVMDNAELTPAKITESDGVRTVHYMNVNDRERVGR